MIDHVWSLLCSEVVTDKETNNISIHNIIEVLTVRDNPKPGGVVPRHFEILTLWARTKVDQPVEGESQIRFISPSGDELIKRVFKIDLTQRERVRNRIIFEGLRAEENGRYYFYIAKKEENNWMPVASIPLTIKFSPLEDDVPELEKEGEV
jgi:hypothetical protein